MIFDYYERGDTYTVHNQGRAITPVSRQATIVWDDGDNVHYRLDNDSKVKQTPKERFHEILNSHPKGPQRGIR